MKLINLSLKDQLIIKSRDVGSLFFGKKAIVKGVVYPRDLSCKIGREIHAAMPSFHKPFVKSSINDMWYTLVDQPSKSFKAGSIVKAAAELSAVLDSLTHFEEV